MELTTVIMIVAPHEVQAIAVPLLRRYAPDTLTRVPAHLTVLYPFVAYDRLDDACAELEPICARIAPFEVTLAGYGEFPSVIYMAPRNPQPIKQLFRSIYRHFPECPPYRAAFGEEMTPHLTVGEFETPEEQHAARKAMPRYAPLTFQATRVHVLYGINDLVLPWLTHAVIPLGGRHH